MSQSKFHRGVLLSSASISAMLLLHTGIAHAGEVTVNQATTVPAVNTLIAGDTDADFTLSITQDGAITGNDDIVLSSNSAASVRTGTVVITNDGNVGTLDANGQVTDIVSIHASGTDQPNNRVTLTNDGLITGGVRMNGFSGSAEIVNTGEIHGDGLFVQTSGDVLVDSSEGVVRDGSVTVEMDFDFQQVTDSETNITTSTRETGEVGVIVADVANAEGTQFGDVGVANAYDDVSLTVDGRVRQASVSVDPFAAEQMRANRVAQAGDTVVTNESILTPGTSSIDFTLTETAQADIVRIENGGSGDTLIDLSGTMDAQTSGQVVVNANGEALENRTVETRDAGDNRTDLVITSSQQAIAGDTTLSVDGDIAVDRFTMRSNGNIALDVSGDVEVNSLNLRAVSGSSGFTASNSTDLRNPWESGPDIPESGNRILRESGSGSADLDVVIAEGASVTAQTVFLSGDGQVTFENAGDAEFSSFVSISAQDSVISSRDENRTAFDGDFEGQTFDGSLRISEETTTFDTGNLDFRNRGTISGNANYLLIATNKLTLSNTGTIDSSVNARAISEQRLTRTLNSQQSVTDNATGADLTETVERNDSERTVLGGVIEFTNGENGVLSSDAPLELTANGPITATNLGEILGQLTVRTSGSNSTNSSDITTTSQTDNAIGFNVVLTETQRAETSSSSDADVVFVNEADSLVEGDVLIEATGNVSILNEGGVFANLNARTEGTVSERVEETVTEDVTTTDAATGAVTETFTFAESIESRDERMGGDITAVFDGLNGAANFVTLPGNVALSAEGDVNTTVGGLMFGNLTVEAGRGVNQYRDTERTSEQTLVDGEGTSTRTQNNVIENEDFAIGEARVSITGRVGAGTTGGGGISVTSDYIADVSLDGGTVDQSIQISVRGENTAEETVESTSQTIAGGMTFTDSLSNRTTQTSTELGGEALLDLANASAVGASVVVRSTGAASASLSLDSSVAGNVDVKVTGAGTVINDETTAYSRDGMTGTVKARREVLQETTPSNTPETASLTVNGSVGRNASVSALNGDAMLLITGTVAEDASASTRGVTTSALTLTEYVGKDMAGSDSLSFDTLIVQPGVSRDMRSVIREEVNVGGSANIVVNATEDIIAAGTASARSLNASGVGGASVFIGNDARIAGSVSAQSGGTNISSTEEFTYDDDGVLVDYEVAGSELAIGGIATATNNGEIRGDVRVQGQEESIFVNNGLVGLLGSGSNNNRVFVGVIEASRTGTIADLDLNDPAGREVTRIFSSTAERSLARLENNGIIEGDVTFRGTDGVLTNRGFIFGETTLGKSVEAFDVTVREDVTGTTTEYSAPKRVTQSYVVNQNNVSGGFVVTGSMTNATDAISGQSERLRTSDIEATINLNEGSVTLGDITADYDTATGERFTNTVVNLNDSGYLGLDAIGTGTDTSGLTPIFTPDLSTRNAFENGTSNLSLGERPSAITGIEAVNKTGTGTFVIAGFSYQDAAGSGQSPLWTMDIGAFNIGAGEVQLVAPPHMVSGGDPNPIFGIRGDVNNDATLVLGRRVTGATGTQFIDGTNVFVEGDFTQSSSGTTVIGFDNLADLEPVQATAKALKILDGGPLVVENVADLFAETEGTSGSALFVDGDLNMAGTIQVEMDREALYLDRDGVTFANYTGTGTVSATALPSFAVNFLGFDVVHDDTQKTISVVTNRKSFDTAATNTNAAAAAAAFDELFAEQSGKIRTDTFSNASEVETAQDISRIVRALDFNLTMDGAGDFFDELSGGDIHASLSAIDQAAVVTLGHDVARTSLLTGEAAKGRVYISPFARTSDIGNGASVGASDLDVDSFGAAFGMDFAYGENGFIGLAFGYGDHDVEVIGEAQSATMNSYSVAAYGTHRFGSLYGSFDASFSQSDVETSRDLDVIFQTTVTADYDMQQLSGALELGYVLGGTVGWTASPYARIEARDWQSDGFSEVGGPGLSLNVAEASHTVFSPIIGARASTSLDAGDFKLRPYADVSYTFQGNVEGDRTVNYAAGGNDFTLQGVNPDAFARIDGGINMNVSSLVDIFAGVSQTFGGDYDVTHVRGGVGFKF